MRRGALARFAFEAAFLVLVAVITGVEALGPVAIVVVMLAALGLVTLCERLIVRKQAHEAAVAQLSLPPERYQRPPRSVPAIGTPEWLEAAAILGVHVAATEPETVEEVEEEPAPEPEPRAWPAEPRRRSWRERRPVADRKRQGAPARKEEQPARPEVESEPTERLCRTCGRPISAERLRAIPTASECIDCKRVALPELAEPAELDEAVPEPEPTVDLVPESRTDADRAAPALPPSPLADAREWNVWELERLARRHGGKDVSQDEEWGFLLVYLREFATPEGLLPADFDALVRESFPALVAAAETS